jgi:hypothetical protein
MRKSPFSLLQASGFRDSLQQSSASGFDPCFSNQQSFPLARESNAPDARRPNPDATGLRIKCLSLLE